ncbi:MAG TPA: AAA family ATPase [Candidatus Baltobacteraceae bacterium]|nr:AAA family ATPase [Candidatus Baltobacteraceae bacterium]
MISSPVGARYVGRLEERAFLREVFAGLRQGGAAVLVEGEAGSGKTRLLQELRTETSAATWIVAQPLQSASEPYAPFYLAISALNRRDAATGEVLAALAPDVQIPTSRRFALMRAWLRACADRASVILAFEDAQWADSASLDLLRFLIQDVKSEPAMFLITVRSGEEPAAIQAMQPAIHRVKLRPLSDEEVLELLRDAVRGRGEIIPERLRRIAVLAEGNPLLAEELLRSALAGEQAETVPSVKRTVETRFARLHSTAQEILQIAALLERIDATELAAASQLSEADVEAALEGALAGELVRESKGKFQFVHALTRTSIVEAMSRTSRKDLHRRIAQWLEKRGADPALLGHHWYEAGEAARAAQANERAGDAAFASHAHADAIVRYKRALDANPDEPQPQLRHKLAVALIKNGDANQAEEHLRIARDTAEQSGDVPLVCACDLSLSFVAWRAGNTLAAVDIAQTALDRLSDREPSELYFKLATRVAMASQIRGDEQRAASALLAAQAFFDLGDDDTRIAFCNTQAMLAASRWQADESADAYARAVEIAERSQNTELLVSTLNNLGLNGTLLGRPDIAFPALRRALEEAYRNGLRWHVVNTAATLARASYLFGRLVEARDALLDALAVNVDSPAMRALIICGYGLPIALSLRDEALVSKVVSGDSVAFALASGEAQFIGGVVGPYVRYLASKGDATGAAALVERGMDALHAGERPTFFLPYVAQFANPSYFARGRELLEALPSDRTRTAERHVFDAHLARREGDKARARSCALAAAAIYRELQWPLLAAESLVLAGHTQEAQRILTVCGAAPGPAAAGVLEQLSAREREVAALAVEGLSNRDIATRLSLSERTIGNHLQSIFNRLGINNRRELMRKMSNQRGAPE